MHAPLHHTCPPFTIHAPLFTTHVPPCHTCLPFATHAPLCHPPATIHASWQPCTPSNHACPPGKHAHPSATMHPPQQPCTPPPPGNHACPPPRNHAPPATTHAPPCEQNQTRLWKHNLAPTLRAVAMSNYIETRIHPSTLLLVLQPHLYIENPPPIVKFPNSNCNRNSYPVNIHSTTKNVGSWRFAGHLPLTFQCSLINIDATAHHRPH